MLTEEQRMQLHRLFSAVESTPEFHESAAKQWSVDGAEMASNLDVYRTFVESGQRRKQDWANALRDAISAVPLLAVFGLCVRDRDGLEQSPKHVVGRHLTFFGLIRVMRAGSYVGRGV